MPCSELMRTSVTMLKGRRTRKCAIIAPKRAREVEDTRKSVREQVMNTGVQVLV